MDNKKWLGFKVEILKNSYEYNSFSKEKFCKHHNINIMEFEKFLNNDITICFETVFKIACALCVELDSLINGSTNPNIIKF